MGYPGVQIATPVTLLGLVLIDLELGDRLYRLQASHGATLERVRVGLLLA